MKKKLLATALLLFSIVFNVLAQVSINDDQSLPDPSAMLDVNSSNKGFLLPRLTTAEIENIYEPADGLLVFNMDNKRFYFFCVHYVFSIFIIRFTEKHIPIQPKMK